MKKLLGILAISALAASAFAQGTITFVNNGTELVRQWTSATDPTLISVPVGGGEIQFLAAPSSTALASALGTLTAGGFAPNYSSLAGFLAANPGWNAFNITGITPVAGRFNGGVVTVSPLATAGGSINYVTIGWTGTWPSLDAAIANGAMIGQSTMLTSPTGNPTITPAGPPSVLNGTYTGITLAPIPEPTSFALAGLGLAALVAFRRRS